MPTTTPAREPVPTGDIDLFSDEARLDPYPRYAALRELGLSLIHI